MQRKRRIIAFAALILVSVAIASTAAIKRQTHQSSQPTILTKQLPLTNGVISIEIRDAKAEFIKPNEVKDFSCVISNNTGKSIIAVVLAYKIVTVNSGGQEGSDTFNLIRESFVHPDVRQAHHFRPLIPGEEFTFESSGITGYENVNIKRVEIGVDYVELEDKTTLGANENGARIIDLIRQGATKYKGWLVQKYTQSGRSIDTVVSLLEAQDLSAELALDDMYLKQGAKVYRRHMLGVVSKHGRAELEKYINR